jgi:hypothetical protein
LESDNQVTEWALDRENALLGATDVSLFKENQSKPRAAPKG